MHSIDAAELSGEPTFIPDSQVVLNIAKPFGDDVPVDGGRNATVKIVGVQGASL
jgi:hypothetical protein